MRSDTRAACCMLCVTMMTVTLPRSWWTSSSTFCVLSGSSDAVGSSSRMTLGPRRQGPGNAESLLLAAGERGRGVLQSLADFIPEAGLLERLLDDLVFALARRSLARKRAESGGDVVADRHRGKRRRALEHHADVASHLDRVHAARVEVAPVEEHFALHARQRHRLVHAVEAPQQRRLPAPRRADDRGHLAIGEVDRHVAHGALRSKERVELAHRDARPRVRLRASSGSIGVAAVASASRRAQSPTPPYRERVTKRASTLMTSTRPMRTSEPAHARRCQSSYGVIGVGVDLVWQRRDRLAERRGPEVSCRTR